MTLLASTRPSAHVGRRSHPLLPYTLSVIALDVLLMLITGALAVWSRDLLPGLSPKVGLEEQLGLIGPLSIAGWLLMTVLLRGYRSDVMGSGPEEFKRVLQACYLTAGLVGIGCYLAKFQFARGFFVITFTCGPVLLLLGRWVARQVLHSLRRRGKFQMRVLVAGSAEGVDEMTRVLRRENWLGMSVVGAALPSGDGRAETDSGVPNLGSINLITALAEDHHADFVIFAAGSVTNAAETRQAVWDLERHHVNVALETRLDDISHERISIRPVGGTPLIQVDSPTWADAGALGKRVFDIVGASLALLVLSPLFLAASVSIWLHDRGPLTFRHQRIGRDGQPFGCLKFRTMHVGAERLAPGLQEQLGHSALLFKLKDDPRVTRPGRMLRRYSIDELPQLVNVLRGDMSLVGPRPQVDREVALYDHAMSRRLLVRPGMTGLWQVSGRNDLSPEEAMRLDLYYVDNWSMLQDLAILTRTVRAVLSSSGAY